MEGSATLSSRCGLRAAGEIGPSVCKKQTVVMFCKAYPPLNKRVVCCVYGGGAGGAVSTSLPTLLSVCGPVPSRPSRSSCCARSSKLLADGHGSPPVASVSLRLCTRRASPGHSRAAPDFQRRRAAQLPTGCRRERDIHIERPRALRSCYPASRARTRRGPAVRLQPRAGAYVHVASRKRERMRTAVQPLQLLFACSHRRASRDSRRKCGAASIATG
jgi:hypothetical protein